MTSDLDLPAGLDGASVGIVIVGAGLACAQDLTRAGVECQALEAQRERSVGSNLGSVTERCGGEADEY